MADLHYATFLGHILLPIVKNKILEKINTQIQHSTLINEKVQTRNIIEDHAMTLKRCHQSDI